MSTLTMSEDSGSAISSPESVDGLLRSLSLESLIGSTPGQDPVPVSHTRRREKARPRRTRDTSGPSGSLSSGNADLNTCLASRCQQLLGTDGSTEYSQTWKRRVTPGGRVYWEHTAKGHPTSDRGSGGDSSETAGYPTCQAHDSHEQGKGRPLTDTGRILCHNGDSHSVNLPGVAGYNTPQARDWKGETSSEGYIQERLAHPRGKNLSFQAMILVGHATPMAADNGEKVVPSSKFGLIPQMHGLITPSPNSATARGGVLDAAFSAWLMGFHLGAKIHEWDICSPGYAEWVMTQKLLGEYWTQHDPTGQGD